MAKETFILTVPPQQLGELRGRNCIAAHLAYRVGRGPHLFRSGGNTPLRGGLMVIDSRNCDGIGPSGPFCQEVTRECLARGFLGAVCDFEGTGLPLLEDIVHTLDEGFHRRGWRLIVPERYAHCTQRAQIMIPSALSGGSLIRRLEEAGEQFGRDRLVLAIQRVAEDFILPSSTGCGTTLTPEQLASRREKLQPSVFFSTELCARYFTYMTREGQAHFVLFDDGETIRKKVEVAKSAGITTVMAPWAEVADAARILGLESSG